jgi:pyruvate formate-lyase activating enzyme-like uncharacterized protein
MKITKEKLKTDILLTQNEEYMVFIENEVMKWHLQKIKARQDKLELLYRDPEGFLAIWNGFPECLTPGCHACLFGRNCQIRHSTKCQMKCDFCYYHNQKLGDMLKSFYKIDNMYFTQDEVALLYDRRPMDATGWLQKEPLLELEKMIPLLKRIADKGQHQYLYTNGIAASDEVLKKLKDNGLNEIRFNLQATDFSDRVLSNMELAVKYIDYVCIETPMFSRTFENYKKHKNRIKNSGIKQINTPELQLKASNYDLFKDEGVLYRHRRGYVSPLSSRHYTYDLIEMAENEKWKIVINDCSNETKWYRGSKEQLSFGFSGIAYDFWLNTPPRDNYIWAIDNVLDQDEYEIY